MKLRIGDRETRGIPFQSVGIGQNPCCEFALGNAGQLPFESRHFFVPDVIGLLVPEHLDPAGLQAEAGSDAGESAFQRHARREVSDENAQMGASDSRDSHVSVFRRRGRFVRTGG